MGFLYFPNIPESTKAPYLKPEEVKLALDRLPPKRADAHNISPWSLTKRVFGSPALYVSSKASWNHIDCCIQLHPHLFLRDLRCA